MNISFLDSVKIDDEGTNDNGDRYLEVWISEGFVYFMAGLLTGVLLSLFVEVVFGVGK